MNRQEDREKKGIKGWEKRKFSKNRVRVFLVVSFLCLGVGLPVVGVHATEENGALPQEGDGMPVQAGEEVPGQGEGNGQGEAESLPQGVDGLSVQEGEELPAQEGGDVLPENEEEDPFREGEEEGNENQDGQGADREQMGNEAGGADGPDGEETFQPKTLRVLERSRVRALPDIASEEVGMLPEGAEIVALEQARDGEGQEWYHIRSQEPELEGYIMASLVEVTGEETGEGYGDIDIKVASNYALDGRGRVKGRQTEGRRTEGQQVDGPGEENEEGQGPYGEEGIAPSGWRMDLSLIALVVFSAIAVVGVWHFGRKLGKGLWGGVSLGKRVTGSHSMGQKENGKKTRYALEIKQGERETGKPKKPKRKKAKEAKEAKEPEGKPEGEEGYGRGNRKGNGSSAKG